MRRVLVGFAILGAAISAAFTSTVVVRPGEAVVVRRFGRALESAWGPGLHFGLPWGAERRDRVALDEIRKIEVGLDDEAAGPDTPPGEGEFLTADGNFVRARAVIQYRIDDPTRFVTAIDERDRLLVRVVEAALSRAFARLSIDQLLVSGRAEAAREVSASVRDSIERSRLGIVLLNVGLTATRPPTEVLPEFNDAQAAASERERRGREATTEAALRRSRAEAKADEIREAAAAVADRAVAAARGKAASFTAIAAQAEKSRALTMRRLYADAVAEMLGKVGRKVIDAGEGVDLGVYGVDR